MKKILLSIGVGVVLAFIASAAARPGAYEYYRFKTGNFPREMESHEIRNAIKNFSSTLSGFYASGGIVAGLYGFPSEKIVKRRIFQDIRNWQEQGKILVMDRDTSTVKHVAFIAPDRAAVVVDETWFSVFQDATTRRPISVKKANVITIRYFMKKMWGKWIVADYEVYPQGMQLPPVPVESFLKW